VLAHQEGPEIMDRAGMMVDIQLSSLSAGNTADRMGEIGADASTIT
jgi:hypothetical protein